MAHYADVDYRDGGDGNADPRRLSTENWDAPIILTTAVQFFESLYANRSSRCRKLHNLMDSVIIFDEAQMLPVHCLTPCVSAIGRLVEEYGCSAVLCTATQPALGPLFQKICPRLAPAAVELCPEPEAMYRFFRRVRYEGLGPLSNEALAQRLDAEKQVLCIVNNREQAQELFERLTGEGCFHLSTMMCPAHRRTVLAEIRRKLKNGAVCRVVSTSLVEAGVDVDFPTVYRAMAGLDSLIQAGGRCNRENEHSLEESVVYCFETDRKAPHTMAQNLAAARRVIQRFDDIASPEAVESYFTFLLYTLKDETALDDKRILEDIRGGSFPFASVAGRFHVIDSPQSTVYIPWGEGAELIEKLDRFGPSRDLLRKLGAYAVGVYPDRFKALLSGGKAELRMENAAVLTDTGLYSPRTGLGKPVGGQAVFL